MLTSFRFLPSCSAAFAIIGGLLLLGTFLRAKVKLFQKLFLPAIGDRRLHRTAARADGPG